MCGYRRAFQGWSRSKDLRMCWEPWQISGSQTKMYLCHAIILYLEWLNVCFICTPIHAEYQWTRRTRSASGSQRFWESIWLQRWGTWKKVAIYIGMLGVGGPSYMFIQTKAKHFILAVVVPMYTQMPALHVSWRKRAGTLKHRMTVIYVPSWSQLYKVILFDPQTAQSNAINMIISWWYWCM